MAMPMSNLLRPFAVTVVLFFLFTSLDGQAAEAEPLDNIRDAAAATARAVHPDASVVDAAQLDPRLRLTPCAEGTLIGAVGSRTASGMNVEVSCASAGWKVNVPVAVKVQVPVLVTRRPMTRGELIQPSDVEVQLRDRATLAAAGPTSIEALSGKMLSRSLIAGSVITSNALAAARRVHRGQSVMLVSDAGGFQVRAEGRALGDGAEGELLRVENTSSRRIVQGQVRADGTVEIPL
ncbi:MAG TPA: flagellar basal body P-ring formation chaperone FlgA [Nevskiaceae bacterium]|nr:flagellar basal body P-ring formation chaperone FlgA [Nevskiaceae bacterium]